MVSRGARGWLGVAVQPDTTVGGTQLTIGVISLPADQAMCRNASLGLEAETLQDALDSLGAPENPMGSGAGRVAAIQAVQVMLNELAGKTENVELLNSIRKALDALSGTTTSTPGTTPTGTGTAATAKVNCKFKWFSATEALKSPPAKNRYPRSRNALMGEAVETGPVGFANIQHVGPGGEEGERFMIGWADNVQAQGIAKQYYVAEVDAIGNMYGKVNPLENTGWGEEDEWAAVPGSGCLVFANAWVVSAGGGPGQRAYGSMNEAPNSMNWTDTMQVTVVCPDVERAAISATATVGDYVSGFQEWWVIVIVLLLLLVLIGLYLAKRKKRACFAPGGLQLGFMTLDFRGDRDGRLVQCHCSNVMDAFRDKDAVMAAALAAGAAVAANGGTPQDAADAAYKAAKAQGASEEDAIMAAALAAGATVATRGGSPQDAGDAAYAEAIRRGGSRELAAEAAGRAAGYAELAAGRAKESAAEVAAECATNAGGSSRARGNAYTAIMDGAHYTAMFGNGVRTASGGIKLPRRSRIPPFLRCCCCKQAKIQVSAHQKSARDNWGQAKDIPLGVLPQAGANPKHKSVAVKRSGMGGEGGSNNPLSLENMSIHHPNKAVSSLKTAKSAHFNEVDLPDGWEKHPDASTGDSFFSHRGSGVTTWDLTKGWESHVDEGSGNTYYHRQDSGTTTWTEPSLYAS